MTLNNLAITKYLVFSISLASAIVLIFPANAQTENSQYDFLEDIEAGKDTDWQFSSEDESISIKDDLRELQEYDASELERKNTSAKEKWGNRGDVEDFSIDTEIYEY